VPIYFSSDRSTRADVEYVAILESKCFAGIDMPQ
jgi:hypothetical protein